MEESKKVQSSKHSQSIPPISGEKPDIRDVCCKVKRVTNAYRLTAIDSELQRRYENESATLHELADYVNNRLTAVTLDTIESPVDTEPATVRAALQGEDSIPATTRDDIRATLAGQVDLDILASTYVSHETIRKHLNDHLNVSTSQGGFETFAELEDALNAYQDQYENGIRSALERAGRKGLIDGKSYRIFNTRVECQYCSETYRLQELLENRGCDCTKRT